MCFKNREPKPKRAIASANRRSIIEIVNFSSVNIKRNKEINQIVERLETIPGYSFFQTILNEKFERGLTYLLIPFNGKKVGVFDDQLWYLSQNC